MASQPLASAAIATEPNAPGPATTAETEAPASTTAEAPAARAAEQPQTGRFAGLTPFQSHGYRFLFFATALTMTGNFMQMIAQGWLIYDLTSSPTWLGIVSFLRGIPMLVLALPAGVLVDRLDRRLVLVTSQGLTALLAVVLAVLVGMHLIQPWHVALSAFLAGCLFVVIVPARQTLVAATVERWQLRYAITLLSAGQNTGRVLGPSLAGIMIAAFGVAVSFSVQAAGFVMALLCSLQLGPRPASTASRKASASESLLEGIRYVRGNPTVAALVALQAIPAFLIMPYTQLLPVYAKDILHTGPDGLGTLMTAMGIGSIVGALSVVLLPIRRQGVILFSTLLAFGVELILFAASTWLPLSIVMMALIGATQSIYLASNNAMVQVATPDELRGRVMSLYMTTWGLMPLGSLPQGALADWVGAPIVTAGSGLLSCLVVLTIFARSPSLRRL